MDAEDPAREPARIHDLFEGSPPNYLLDTVTYLRPVLANIDRRLAAEEMPKGTA